NVLIEEYAKLLHWGLNNRWKVIAGAFTLFLASLALVPLGFIGSEFIPAIDRGEFSVTLELMPGSTIENTNYVTRSVEDTIAKFPEVQKLFVNAGVSAEGLIGRATNNASQLNVTLVPAN